MARPAARRPTVRTRSPIAQGRSPQPCAHLAGQFEEFAEFAISRVSIRKISHFQSWCQPRILRKLRIMTTPPGTVELRELVLPVHANHRGTLFAGTGLELLAKVAFLSARSL